MAEFSGWNDQGMKGGDADKVRGNSIWVTLEMFRQALVERCREVYPALYYAYYGEYPAADSWKTLVYEQNIMLSEFSPLKPPMTYIKVLNNQLNVMIYTWMSGSNKPVWGHLKGADSYIMISGSQAGSDIRWEDPCGTGSFHAEKTVYYSFGGREISVLASFDASLNGSVLSMTDVAKGTHSYGAPHSITINMGGLTRAKLITATDPDGIDWYSQLATTNQEALRYWVNQFYQMLNLLTIRGGWRPFRLWNNRWNFTIKRRLHRRNKIGLSGKLGNFKLGLLVRNER